MNRFKTVIFTSHFVVFNETFSQLGKNGEDTAVVWHKAVVGRTDGDIASSFHAYISSLREETYLMVR